MALFSSRLSKQLQEYAQRTPLWGTGRCHNRHGRPKLFNRVGPTEERICRDVKNFFSRAQTLRLRSLIGRSTKGTESPSTLLYSLQPSKKSKHLNMVSFLTRLATASCLSLGIFSSIVQGQNITNDTYFYGQSESVLPSREFLSRNTQNDSIYNVD